MKSRPNKSYVLQVMRDGDFDDPWGTAMGWAFACAEALTIVEAEVPEGLEYSPSPFGAVTESYEDVTVLEYLGYDVQADEYGNVTSIVPPKTVDPERIADVQHAARCLDRYLDWCRAAGRDY